MPNLTGYGSTGINIDIQNYIADIQENQELITGKYATNENNVNFKEMVTHLFPGQVERFKTLNPGSYIGGSIDDKISSYVGIPKDKLDYRFNYDMLVETILTTGYIMVKLSSDKTNGWRAHAIEGHKYYDDGVTELFIEQYKVEEKNPIDNQLMSTTHYVYVQSFSNHELKNELFEIQAGILSYGKPVSLDIIPELSGRPESQIIMDMDKLVHKIKIESSLISKIKTIIYSIERKYAEADKQFQNYMDQFIVFQNIEIPKSATKTVYHDGNPYEVTDFDKLGKIVEIDADNGTGNIQIIKNGNELINEALDFAERQLQMISSITDVPKIFLGLDNTEGNNSGTFIVKSSGAFFKRIERYRTSIENVFEDLDKAFKIKTNFIWPSIITTDPDTIIDSEIKLVEAGLTTKIMSIMKIHNVEEDEAKTILDNIRLDQKIDAPTVVEKDPIL